jgi:ABC transporter transmembrane protein
MSPKRTGSQSRPPGAGPFALLKPYRRLVAILVVLTIAGNGLTLVVPKLISRAIDAYTQRAFVLSTVVLQFFVVAFLVFALNYLQNIVQTYASERVARDLRTRLAAKIATQSYSSIERLTPAKLLTNLTSFQKPCIPDSRSLGNDQFKAKLLRPFGQRSDLLLAIPGFVVFGPFINVGVSVFDKPVEQAG